MNKRTVAIIYGGKSAEHEVSVNSARNVYAAIDRNQYDVVLIGVSKSGRWHLTEPEHLARITEVDDSAPAISLLPGGNGQIISESGTDSQPQIDIVFSVLHGPFGEDGTTQGLLKLAGIPFVGAGVLGSAVGMDKVIMKRLLREAGLPIAKFVSCLDTAPVEFEEVVKELGLPFFIKPANLGSSVGVNKVHSEAEYGDYLKEAFTYDHKVIIEENIIGRELECAILGNNNPLASALGEVILHEEFFSYSAKYQDAEGASTVIPAKLDVDLTKKVKNLAISAFQTLECVGIARVDFFLRDDGQLIVNEINTLPGFTSTSMYPKLWAHEGIGGTELIDRLLTLALELHAQDSVLRTAISS